MQSMGVAAAALAVAAADVTEDVGCLDETGLATLKGFRKLLRKEKSDLLQQRLSVREMASQFEREQAAAHAAAATLAHVQQKVKLEMARHEQHDQDMMKPAALVVSLKNLRSLLWELTSSSGRGVKNNSYHDHDIVADQALIALEVVESQWLQRESELEQERMEIRQMAITFKQASEDARRMIDEERAKAQSEIEAARAATLRVEAALEQQAEALCFAKQQELEELRMQVKEAQRIMMLHGPSKVMDMEYQIAGLHQLLTDKALENLQLRKKLEAAKRQINGPTQFEIQGEERLGACLAIAPTCAENAPELHKCIIQWFSVSAVDGSKVEPIKGANRPQYAPDPVDVGKLLRVDVGLPDGQLDTLFTSGPLDPAPGLGNQVEALARKGSADFNVRVYQENGEVMRKPPHQVLVVDKMRIKLLKGRCTKVKEEYSSAMQLCGGRGGGDAAARSLYWSPRKGVQFMLVLESERDRNAAIMLARQFAFSCNIILGGPDDC
ncbi:unnamed protein product [Sphagnum troendelagicum]|uniref:Stomatal closure-related actin-binding protein 1 n=1 Tax=Sphagnum troendelagicum TaxID=128251 RepID=A0ABP0TYY5_9BRYO